MASEVVIHVRAWVLANYYVLMCIGTDWYLFDIREWEKED